ncbi:transcriptional regulator [Actinopolyspora mzabensis]|uniref:Transcriptional regulator n=1 Tax=Actinopolyspora mzabensis TaxID=995066 RepID=A0A1G9EP18_ACTMZ|nr:IclR family transcriptional regulator C-terminal domain-containing protein [Actinopolyspora mzabensis]SDK77957.1 transcriptional regulator [Actinopolyspora mzabensis]
MVGFPGELARAPTWLQEEILAGPLHAYTPRTVVDTGELRAMLAEVRRSGIALCRGFIATRATGVDGPLRTPNHTVVAALSMIVPNDEQARTHVPALQAATRGISHTRAGHDHEAHRGISRCSRRGPALSGYRTPDALPRARAPSALNSPSKLGVSVHALGRVRDHRG